MVQDWSTYRTPCTINTGLILRWRWCKCLCIDLSQTERFYRNLEFNSTALFTKSLIYTKCQAPDNLTAWKELCLWQENMPRKREMRFHNELIHLGIRRWCVSGTTPPNKFSSSMFSEQCVRQQCDTVVVFQRHFPAVPPEKGPDSRRRRIRWGQIVPESRARSYTAVTAVKHQRLAGVSQRKVWMSDMLRINKKNGKSKK